MIKNNILNSVELFNAEIWLEKKYETRFAGKASVKIRGKMLNKEYVTKKTQTVTQD